MTANAVDFGSAALGAFRRAVGLVALALGAGLALVFAFAAAMVVGLMISGAALTMSLWPRRRSGGDILEARRTPAGWVVETAAKRKA
jgi:hypothetical protein